MQSQSRAVLPLLILIILALVCLFLARAEASEPESGSLCPERPAVSVYVLYNVAKASDPSHMEHAGSALTALPPGDTATSPPYWSPDGQVLYFSVRDRRTGVSSLRLVTRDGR